MKRTLLALLLVFAFVACQKNHVRGEEVTYKFGDQTLKGLLAYAPEQTGKRPAVLVVHEWWGNNDYSRKRAMQLAELGYVALAIDMYGDGKIASNPDEAGKMAGGVMKDFEKKSVKKSVRTININRQTFKSKLIFVFYRKSLLESKIGSPIKLFLSCLFDFAQIRSRRLHISI